MLETKTKNSLHFKVPHGKQSVYYRLPSNNSSLIRDYDAILVIFDKRIMNIKPVDHIIKSLALGGRKMYKKFILINNKTKSTDLLIDVFNAMSDARLSRSSLIISVGGGATADLVGTAAALYMRGIDYAVIPTSYISIADGIISKVAVNHRNTKNMVGAFRSPRWSLTTPELLSTFSFTQIVQGLVEVWKHALLQRNRGIEDQIVTILLNKDPAVDILTNLAEWSMNIKAQYVLVDWDDTKAIHKALSLGHTTANYLEMNDMLHHSEAVLYGIVFEAIIAKNRGLLSSEDFDSLVSIAALFGKEFNVYNSVSKLLSAKGIFEFLARDKISSFNRFKFVLPTSNGFIVEEILKEEINLAVLEFNTLVLC